MDDPTLAQDENGWMDEPRDGTPVSFADVALPPRYPLPNFSFKPSVLSGSCQQKAKP